MSLGMTVNLTLFLWLVLYASTSRVLKLSVAERTHMVSVVPLSAATPLAAWSGVLEAQAESESGTARVSSTAIPRPR